MADKNTHALKRKIGGDDNDGAEKTAKSEYQCATCFKTFTLTKSFTRHVLTHQTFHVCGICGKKFRRRDYLTTHQKRKHSQTGGQVNESKQSDIPNRNKFPSTAILDHDNIRSPSRTDTAVGTSMTDHNYSRPNIPVNGISSVTNNDHDYARPFSHGDTYNSDHTYVKRSTTTKQSALNDTIHDEIMIPNKGEKYDMLTFFANVKSEVEKFLKSRLQKTGIKWYLSVQVELIKDTPDADNIMSTPHFRSLTNTTLNIDTFDQHALNESFQKMFESFEKYIRESSGWVLKKVVSLAIHTVKYSPISASSYIELPYPLRRSQSLLNIRNLDQKCFLWSCLASIHPSDSPLVSDYTPYENELNMSGISYPVGIQDLNKFETQNPSFSVSVFAYEDHDILPMRITKHCGRLHHVNLLLIKSDTNSHYCLIKNLNNFLRKAKQSTNHCFYCPYCLHGFTKETLQAEHVLHCKVHGEQKIELPSNKDCFLEFKDYEKQLRVPYVIYADFETLNVPQSTSNLEEKATQRFQLLEPCSFGYKVISTDENFVKDTVTYRGPDAAKKLIESLLRESHEIEQRLLNPKPLTLSEEEEMAFKLADKCCICKKIFADVDTRARHHDHTSGKYIGASHMHCNLQCKQANFIPVIFHGLKNFDSHLLCQGIGYFKDQKLKCIPQTMEKYISFSIGRLRFIDSFGFLPSSLETLVDNLAQNGLQSFHYFQHEIKEHADILLRKGVYPYEYMDSWEKFNETQLPSFSNFYSSIKKEHISDEDYAHAKHVFELLKLKSLGDYHDLYLKTDVLLLADVFEQFRNMSQQCYDLDPCHFYTSPGLSWQAMLKMTGVTLELMTDIDQILFIEQGIRGGISQISNRYKKANNQHLENYDSSKETSYLAYYDINNLYGLSLSDRLPIGYFRFLNPEELATFDVKKIPEDGSKGYILEVDLEYPESLHDSHNDYPLAPERKFIPNEMLSPYAQRVWKKLHNQNVTFPPRAKVEKLLTTLIDKDKYVLHYKNLQLYLQLGMKLKAVHRILEFDQEPFMKVYVEYNTSMRKNAKSTFEKNFFKLMNNSVFGKTMENLRKHRSVELCHTEKRLKKLSAKPTYKMHRIFSEDLVGVELSRRKVKLNKPIYIGMSVLDLSKRTMYDFYYNHLKKHYSDKVQLQMTDTDSFLISCITNDLFLDISKHLHLFDTSDFPRDHALYSDANKKVMGKMKIETNEKCISEYCGLRSKMYAFSCDGEEDKRAKGIAKVVVRKELRLQHYKNALFDETSAKSEMNLIRSHDHIIYCEKISKTGLSCFDDKRYILDDGITSLAYGHYKIKT